MVGRHWLDKRLAESTDVLRCEIGYLLENKPILPVLVDDAGMPSLGELPEALYRLPSIQARSISNANWEAVMLQLIGTGEGILARSPTIASSSGHSPG